MAPVSGFRCETAVTTPEPAAALHALIDRHIRDRGQQAAGHHQPLAADAIGQCADHHEQRHAEQQRDGDDELTPMSRAP